MTIDTIPIDVLALDLRVRVAVNDRIVRDYARALADGVSFPPVVAFQIDGVLVLADGHHRLHAARQAGRDAIDVDVRIGTRDDALWFALGANRHGLQLTENDQQHAIVLATQAWPERSTRALAEQIGTSRMMVDRVRRSLSHAGTGIVHGRNGQAFVATRPTNVFPTPETAALESKVSRHPAAAAARRQVMYAMAEAGRATNEIAAAVGIGVVKVRETLRQANKLRLVRDAPQVSRESSARQARVEQIRVLADRGYSSQQIADEIHISVERVRHHARVEQIDLRADRCGGRSRRMDPNRIVEQMAYDAELLTADVNLIDFTQINRAAIGGWLTRFHAAQRALTAFLRRLEKEKAHDKQQQASEQQERSPRAQLDRAVGADS